MKRRKEEEKGEEAHSKKGSKKARKNDKETLKIEDMPLEGS